MSPEPAAIFANIPAAARVRTTLRPLFLFAVDYIGYALFLAGAMVLPGIALKAVCVVGATMLIGGLYVLGHDAGHGILVPNRRLNRWLARLCFLPSYAPLAGWFRAHVLLHHYFLRVKGRDMVWAPWTVEEYRAAPLHRRLWYRFLRTPQRRRPMRPVSAPRRHSPEEMVFRSATRVRATW